jgi:hypothetical protein
MEDVAYSRAAGKSDRQTLRPACENAFKKERVHPFVKEVVEENPTELGKVATASGTGLAGGLHWRDSGIDRV